MSVAVAVCIVTYRSAADLPGCLAAIAELEHRPLEVVLVDCAGGDDCTAIAKAWEAPGICKQLLALDQNLGFAGGMNTAFAQTVAPFLLTLNADARPERDYVCRLLAVLLADPDAGCATGRLLRPPGAAEQRLDACGMFLTRNWRHFDRGSGELDHGQYAAPEQVFGATGAASLFRRAALDDVAIEGNIFDPDFHSFREDAELAFRLQERQWRVLYEPRAQAEHRRFNLPSKRRQMPAAVNYHSLKNRYLLRLYHQTSGNFLRTLLPTTTRDLLALVYVALFERSSFAAYRWLWRHRHTLAARRRLIQARRSAAPGVVEGWFGRRSLPR